MLSSSSNDMNIHTKPLLFLTIMSLSHFPNPIICSLNSFIYVGCSQQKYNSATTYDSTVTSLLNSLLNSASLSNFNDLKMSPPGSDTVYGLFQCRGDITNSDCHDCVSAAVGRLGTSCGYAVGGAVQLEGCFVRYDNTSFVGEQDKTVVWDKCGPSDGYESERDAALAYLTAGGDYFRVSGSGKVQGVAQCVQDLSMTECQDCVSDAIQRLKTECGSSTWGDVFLAKCYARYSERGYTATSSSKTGNDDELDKTLAIFIGLIAGVAVLVVFLSVLNKVFDKKGGGAGGK